MSFKENIFTALGISDLSPVGFRLTVMGKSGVYIEGVKRLIDISSTKIAVDAKQKIITLNGINLNVKSLGGGDACISGEITGLEIKDKK